MYATRQVLRSLRSVGALLPQVEDPHGQMVHEVQQKFEGQFAFTTKTAGEYKACFTVKGESGVHTLGGSTLMLTHTIR